MTWLLADKRWYVRRMDGNWEIYDVVQGEREPVRVMADEPGLTADLVLERWKQEREEDDTRGDRGTVKP